MFQIPIAFSQTCVLKQEHWSTVLLELEYSLMPHPWIDGWKDG